MISQKLTRVDKSIEKPIGQALRSIRQSRGISSKHLAISLGISNQQFLKYENGINRISVSRLIAISYILQMDISELFNSLCLAQTTENFQKIPSKFLPTIEDFFISSSEEEQKALCQLLKSLTHLSPTTSFHGGNYAH